MIERKSERERATRERKRRRESIDNIVCEVQQRTTGTINGIVDETFNTGNRDEDGNGDNNDTDVDMEVDA